MRLKSQSSFGDVVVVLKRRSERAISTFFIFLFGGVGLYTFPFTIVNQNESLASTLGFCLFMSALLWFFGAIRGAVTVVYEGGLLVRDWFARYWIPWSVVVDVEAEHGLAVQLTDGNMMGLGVGQQSLLSRLWGNRRQHRLSEQIENVWERADDAGTGDVASIEREWVLGVGRLLIWLVLYLGTFGATLWGMELAN